MAERPPLKVWMKWSALTYHPSGEVTFPPFRARAIVLGFVTEDGERRPLPYRVEIAPPTGG